jgi:hypothetical protein
MMKRGIVGVAFVALTIGFGPTQAGTIKKGTLTFNASVPCAVALCSYWFNEEDPTATAACPAGTEADACERLSSYACTHPRVEGTYDDKILKAPKGAKLLQLAYTPDVDWDLYICKKPATGNNGTWLASEQVDALTDCQVGCAATLTAKVKAGQRYVVRGYNFSDPSALKATYKFVG